MKLQKPLVRSGMSVDTRHGCWVKSARCGRLINPLPFRSHPRFMLLLFTLPLFTESRLRPCLCYARSLDCFAL